ncbi:MAG: RraA family protein [Eubacteriaceae bacterium]|jgi:regulator of RNase E activity RraA|nr:RraA family protein [Eubacteriaceae bacterium]
MMISKESFDEKYRKRLERLETTNIADALDALGYHFFPWGVEPMTTPQKNIVGRAVTVQITAAGTTKSKGHMCVNAIEAAEAGDVIVIANGGKVDVNCWGGLLATASKMKGLAGTVIDGACRDIQDYDELDYQVYARGRVVATARGHLIEQSTNEMIRFGDVQVHPGDIVCADKSGVVFIPQVMLDDTIVKAEELQKKEDDMCAELKAGRSMGDLDKKYDYEHMLKKEKEDK